MEFITSSVHVCCEVLPQYMYVLRAYLTVKTYVLRGVLERQTRCHPQSTNPSCLSMSKYMRDDPLVYVCSVISICAAASAM